MKKNVKCIIASLLLTVALFLSYELLNEFHYTNYKAFYSIKSLEASITCIFLFLFYKKTMDNKTTKINKVFAFIFSLFIVLGSIYVSKLSLEKVFSSIDYIALFIIKILGYYFLFDRLLIYLEKVFDYKPNNKFKFKNKYILKYIDSLNNKPFKTSFITLSIILFLYLICFYPIVLSPDPAYQIIQYFNMPTHYNNWMIQLKNNVFLTNHHPVLQTFMIGGAIDLGRTLFRSDSIGLFIYCLIQATFMISVLSFTIKYMVENKVPIKIVLIVLLNYVFVPMYISYSISTVKDVYYTALMIIYCLFIFDYIKNYKEKSLNIKQYIFITLVMILLCLFRNNGIYVIILSYPFILIYNKKNICKLLLTFIIFFGSLTAYNKIFIPSMGISPGSIREALSVPFQQTARYVMYHEDEVSLEEKKVIDKVLGYENLANYNPTLSDNVKNNYNPYSTKEDLKNYFIVWFKEFLKHPITYIDATLYNSYGYIYPSSHNWYLYTEHDNLVNEYGVLDYHFNKLKIGRKIISVYGNVFPYIPVIGLISCIGFNTWLIILEVLYLIRKNKKKYIICLVPLIVTILVCIVGPANTYFRYAIPYMFTIPSLFALINTTKEE